MKSTSLPAPFTYGTAISNKETSVRVFEVSLGKSHWCKNLILLNKNNPDLDNDTFHLFNWLTRNTHIRFCKIPVCDSSVNAQKELPWSLRNVLLEQSKAFNSQALDIYEWLSKYPWDFILLIGLFVLCVEWMRRIIRPDLGDTDSGISMSYTIDLGFCRAHATSCVSGLDALASLSIYTNGMSRWFGWSKGGDDLEDILVHSLLSSWISNPNGRDHNSSGLCSAHRTTFSQNQEYLY